jgi:hypothetical protein
VKSQRHPELLSSKTTRKYSRQPAQSSLNLQYETDPDTAGSVKQQSEFPPFNYMQPEPIEPSTQLQTQNNAPEPSNTSHHGFLPAHLHPADLRNSLEEDRVELPDSGHPADAAESEFGEDPGLPTQLRRLRLDQGIENKPKASFQRISEYENALSPSPPRKQSEGPGFKVIKHKGKNTLDGTEFERFPNGMLNCGLLVRCLRTGR